MHCNRESGDVQIFSNIYEQGPDSLSPGSTAEQKKNGRPAAMVLQPTKPEKHPTFRIILRFFEPYSIVYVE